MSYIKDYNYDLLKEVIYLNNFKEPIDWKNLFKNHNPIAVEIGCGNGHFLINKSKQNPYFNYIGIDIKEKRIIRCREKELKYNINNIKWICEDGFMALNNLFENDVISKIYMTFPDPWPKNKHHKNRLFKKEFVDLIYDKLANNGIFIFITDYKEYFDECIDLASKDERFNLLNNLFIFEPELKNSLFGKKWEKDNRNFYSFCIVKK